VHFPASLEVIGDSSFHFCEGLKSITFDADSKLKRIEYSAFTRIILKSVHLPASLEMLGEHCFGCCWSLTAITFGSPSKLEPIQKQAFASTPVANFIIPASVTFLTGSAFDVKSLLSFAFSPASPHFRMNESMLEDNSGQVLIRYFDEELSRTLSRSVEVIGESCFAFCTTIELIAFESDSKLSRIEKCALWASDLRSIVISASVEVMCESGFCACKSLRSVTFAAGSKLSRIEARAFSQCRFFAISIPASVEVICRESFWSHSGLRR
jgi:hypothetical protein